MFLESDSDAKAAPIACKVARKQMAESGY